MKYWLFDGKDVLGPFTLQTLAARTDFSATSFICAGETGEESDGWQVASSFKEFRFHPVSGQLEGVFLPDGKEVSTNEIPAQMAVPAAEKLPAHETAPQPKPRAEKTIEEPPTVMLAKEDVDLVLPSHPAENQPVTPEQAPSAPEEPQPTIAEPSVPETETHVPQETPMPSEPVQEPTPSETQASITVQPATTDSPQETQTQTQGVQPPLTVTPEEEILSTCTLPLVNEILQESNLPQLPPADFEPVPLPDTPGFELKEVAADASLLVQEAVQEQTDSPVVPEMSDKPQENTPAQESPKTQEQPLQEPEEDTEQTAPIQEPVAAPRPPREQTLHRLEQVLENRPVSPDFLERQTPTHKKASIVLWILLVAVVVVSMGVFGLARMKAHGANLPPKTTVVAASDVPKKTPATPAVQPAPQPVSAVQTTAPATAAQKPIVPPKPVTAQDKALAAVQNYQLPNDKGTIAAYFDKLYQNHLAQGYTASWSVEPLHKSIYIVKYRLTKTRTEPIVYVFQADGVNGKLTGALNNVALDLVGRINQN